LPVLFMMILGMACGVLAWSWAAPRVGFDPAKVHRLIGGAKSQDRGER
jgi:hypothetical protein